MSNAGFNEAERYLIENWATARRMEETMSGVRDKLERLCKRVRDEIVRGADDLDYFKVRVTQSEGHSGSIVFSRKSWRGDKEWPAGLWVENIRLEQLFDEQAPRPLSSIWLPSMKRLGADPEPVKRAIRESAERILSREEKARCVGRLPDERYVLGFEFVSKQDLVKMLLDGSGDRFLRCLAEQFQLLARFTPVLDQLLIEKAG